MSDRDLILVGGGLANMLIALRLAETQPRLNLLVLEQDAIVCGNHTWSFHGSDLTATQLEWIRPLINHSWQDYDVSFPGRRRTLSGTYHSIASEQMAQFAEARLGERIKTSQSVRAIEPSRVVLEDGTELNAAVVIDGRGPAESPGLDVRFQKFVGQVLQLEQPHNLKRPVIMDATQSQDDGYRFFYLLPLTESSLLIEDTYYSDTASISIAQYGDEIRRYAESYGWEIRAILREEAGVLPITLGGDIHAFWDASADAVPRSGLRAALFHPATGYSLPEALRLADRLATEKDWTAANIYRITRHQSEDLWRRTRFYRALNRMLFLAASPSERRTVLERFYGLNGNLIARFYAGSNTLGDKARILVGKPPVKLSRAFDAVFRYRYEMPPG